LNVYRVLTKTNKQEITLYGCFNVKHEALSVSQFHPAP